MAEKRTTINAGVGVALGAGIGAALFAATSDPVWIGIGVAIGAGIGAAASLTSNSDDDEAEDGHGDDAGID